MRDIKIEFIFELIGINSGGAEELQRLDEKYWQHCCHMTTASSKAASFVDMNKDCWMS